MDMLLTRFMKRLLTFLFFPLLPSFVGFVHEEKGVRNQTERSSSHHQLESA